MGTTQKLSIRHLINVAIGNPEPGIVNFNALYTVLQAISEKLELDDEDIEVDSSYCPVSTNNILDSRSNISSERLMDRQMFVGVTEGIVQECCKDGTEDDPEGKKSHNHPPTGQEQADERKVIFDASNQTTPRRQRETERGGACRSEMRQYIDALNTRLGKIEDMFVSGTELEQSFACVRQRVSQLEELLHSVQQSIVELRELRQVQEADISACRKKLEHDRLASVTDDIKVELAELKKTVASCSGQPIKQVMQSSAPPSDAVKDLAANFAKQQSQLLEVRAQACELEEKLSKMEHYISSQENASQPVPLETYQNEMSVLNNQIETVCSKFQSLQNDYEAQLCSLDEMRQKLEDMTRNKVDKEEIDELLSEKADYTMLQRKVSVENMDADRRKLEKQINEVSQCLITNEEIVRKQFDDIKRLLGDQSLEDMMYEFKLKIDKEIQVVRDAIRRLANMKPDADAAAARLRDLQCISCDQDVVMKAVETNNLTKFSDAFASKTVGPNVAFEVGQLRVAGKAAAEGLGMGLSQILLESKHRHCGGEHTIITNKERVTKMRGKTLK